MKAEGYVNGGRGTLGGESINVGRTEKRVAAYVGVIVGRQTGSGTYGRLVCLLGGLSGNGGGSNYHLTDSYKIFSVYRSNYFS